MIGVVAALMLCSFLQTHAFSASKHQRVPTREYQYLTATSSSTPSPEIDRSQLPENTQHAIPTGEAYSTLTLLEHIHLLTPNVHQKCTSDGSKNIVDLFVNTMGFGLDPKGIKNINNESGKIRTK